MSKLVFQDKQTVYYADTDAYSVLWHGASVKWFEKGRVELVKMYGIDAFELERQGIIMPVVELNIRYKSSAFLSDNLSIATEIQEVRPSAITFLHTVSNSDSGKVHIIAHSTVVCVDKIGKLYRKLPDVFDKLKA